MWCTSPIHRLPCRRVLALSFPVRGRSSPVLGDVAQSQPDELGGRIVAGEVPAGFDDLSQPRIHALDCVGRVDDATHIGRESKEWNDLVPGPLPSADDGGELKPPRNLDPTGSRESNPLEPLHEEIQIH